MATDLGGDSCSGESVLHVMTNCFSLGEAYSDGWRQSQVTKVGRMPVPTHTFPFFGFPMAAILGDPDPTRSLGLEALG